MRIEVNVNGRRYGGYNYNGRYSVTLDYADFSWNAGNRIDFEEHKDMAKQIERALIGKRATDNIKDSLRDEVIVYKRETIAKLHVQKILENWNYVEFGKTSLAEKIKKLRRQCTRRLLKTEIRKNSGGDVEITFETDGRYQRSGTLVIPPTVANWLGKKLTEASTGDIQENGCAIAIGYDGKVIEKK